MCVCVCVCVFVYVFIVLKGDSFKNIFQIDIRPFHHHYPQFVLSYDKPVYTISTLTLAFCAKTSQQVFFRCFCFI